MIKLIKTKLQAVAANPWVSGATLLLYMGLVGPALVSADDTFLVVLGLLLGFLTGYWALKTFFKQKQK